MLASLLLTAFVMGLAGGPHCIAMCGAACGTLHARSSNPPIGQSTHAVSCTVRRFPLPVVSQVPWSFYLGRLLGYGLLGGVAAETLHGLAWLSDKSHVFQPLWTFSHTLIFAWGLLLLFTGRQPQWAVARAQAIWGWLRSRTQHPRLGFLLTGMVWALLPCGLLYSAVLLASLQSQWLQGALVMMAFATGSALLLAAAPLLWQWGQRRLPDWLGEAIGFRISGLILISLSLVALWMDVMHHDKLWCQVL